MSVREYDLQINDEEKLPDIIQALNASVRRQMMSLLSRSSYSIADLAKKLKLPISTVSFHVNILRKAGFVNVTVKRNTRGNAKIVSRQIDRFSLGFLLDTQTKSKTFSMEIPLGSFCDAQIEAGCGMANGSNIIIADDTPGVFFSPERYSAQIIWFAKGYLEYRIPNYMMRDKKVNAVTFSMELCSEAPNYRNDWESDITFWVNGQEVATYVSPGDFGGRRGRLNPPWWSDFSTQYGIIKTIRITNECVYLDENAVSTLNIGKLGLQAGDYITLRIGIKKDAHHQGGLNLFGEQFGDYAQGLVFTVDYN
ncbi:MAG: ArsR family transcriptional regulator [Clostridia bacterium]|jgi:predicted transcriptional regulator|nr:ArsR family transcriptional regulator [Clostridia bacterium]